MDKSHYKFSYFPMYTDILYIGIFLFGAFVITLRKHPLFLIFSIVAILVSIFYFIIRKPRLFFFEDYFEQHTGFGKLKKIQRINYSDVQKVKYCFTEIRGNHLFKISFNQDGDIRTLQYSFTGRASKYEISFLKLKNIAIQVIPETAKNKIN